MIQSGTGYALAAGGAEFCKWPDDELELTLAGIFYRYNRGFCCDSSMGNHNKLPSYKSSFLVKPRNSFHFVKSKFITAFATCSYPEPDGARQRHSILFL
jgi:hypothetical protein